MFRQRKLLDIYIGDECDTMKAQQKPERNGHSSHSFINLFKKKSNKKEPNIKRVKSANNFAAQEANSNETERNDEPLSSQRVNVNSLQVPAMSKSLPRTKSMPNMSKNVENNGAAEVKNKEVKKSKASVSKSKNQEGQKQLHQLVKYLHTDTPLITYKQEMDSDDIELVRDLDHCIDLNKYLEQNLEVDTNDFWKNKARSVLSEKSKHNSFPNAEDSLSANGFRLVRRFGSGIPDGCGFPLSLKKEETTSKSNTVEWPQILAEAEQTLHKLENFNRNVRRGSLLQPRIMFISFYPESGWQKIRQIGHCLPLRKWTSELLFESKEAAQLLDSDCKRHLKSNVSVGNLQQWMTAVSNDKTFLKEHKFERPADQHLVAFRRHSLNENVWNANDLLLQRRIDYTKKMKLFTSHSSDNDDIQVPKRGTRSRLRSIFVCPETEPNTNASEIEHLTSDTIAHTLTIIVRDLFLEIKPTEICQLLLKPNLVDEETCPAVAALLGFQKRIINLFTTSIVELPTVEQRAKRIALFIEVAEQLKHIRNWHSMFSVISSCQSPPVARLKQTWNYLSLNYSDHFCEFFDLSDTLRKKFNENTEHYCIPVFDDWLRDLKARCNLKLNSPLNKSTRGQWQKAETIAVWLDSEIISLEQLASKQKHSAHSTAETHTKSLKKRTLIQRLRSNFSHKGDNINTVLQKAEIECNDTEKVENNCQNWQHGNSVKQSLDCGHENNLFEEMTSALNEYKSKAAAYQFSDVDEMAKNFLLLHSYKTMHENMSHSYADEPPNTSS